MYSTFKFKSSGCTTCTNQTLKSLGKLRGIFGAEIDRISGEILVNHTDEVSREEIAKSLSELGYFEEKNNDSNCELNT